MFIFHYNMEKFKVMLWLQLVALVTLLLWGCAGQQKLEIDSDSQFEQAHEIQRETKANEKQADEDGAQTKMPMQTESLQEVVVFVCGAVNAPGVYQLKAGSRAADALAAAGGMREDAQSDILNLAQEVTDGQQIRIPFIGEEAQAAQTDRQEEQSSSDDPLQSSKVNLNTASAQQLMTIPGIGQAKANSIIKYRQERGEFASVQEIMQIEGIKQGVFEKIKDYICVE